MTFEILKGWFLSINLRNGVGIDLEFHWDKPVWITYQSKGEVHARVSEFDGVEILIPFMRLSFGQLFEIKTHSDQ